MKPANKAEIVAYLKTRTPVVHEVTEENRADISVRYNGVMEGWVLWEVQGYDPGPQVLGVLWSTTWAPPDRPLYLELIERLSLGSRPAWAWIRGGQPVIDDAGVVRVIRTAGAEPQSIVEVNPPA